MLLWLNTYFKFHYRFKLINIHLPNLLYIAPLNLHDLLNDFRSSVDACCNCLVMHASRETKAAGEIKPTFCSTYNKFPGFSLIKNTKEICKVYLLKIEIGSSWNIFCIPQDLLWDLSPAIFTWPVILWCVQFKFQYLCKSSTLFNITSAIREIRFVAHISKPLVLNITHLICRLVTN